MADGAEARHYGSGSRSVAAQPLTVGAPIMMSFQFLATWIRAHLDDERGASLVEYALLVALIAIVCIAAITLLGGNANTKFSTVANSIG
ncbi:MAG: pilus assembly protein Flp/PilA [Acidimicrobiaceae bacterium]